MCHHTWIFVSVCVVWDIHVHAVRVACACVWKPKAMLDVFLYHSVPCSLCEGFLLNPELSHFSKIGWPVSLLGPPVSTPLSLPRVQACSTTPIFIE